MVSLLLTLSLNLNAISLINLTKQIFWRSETWNNELDQNTLYLPASKTGCLYSENLQRSRK